LICCILLGIAIYYPSTKSNNLNGNFDIINVAKAEDEDCIYLSDIDYIANQSSTQWGSILKDATSANSKISVKVEGAYYTFDKGMWAHATSTLVYDISTISTKYKYFTTFIGLNATAASSSNGVKYYIYTSVDGKKWDLQTPENPKVFQAGANAELVKINITGAKYLKLYADNNGNNGNDHSVYADAKFTNNESASNVVLSVEEYDELLKKYSSSDFTNKEYELLLYQRTLVNNVGQYALTRFVTENNDNKIAFDWLFNNVENLREYIMGGTPDGGSYYNSLNVLSKLYKNYKTDLDNKTLLNNRWDSSLTYSDLYRKMMMAIALTHSQTIGLWMHPDAKVNQADPLRRYAIYRYMHKNGNMVVTRNADGTPNADITPWFEYLRVEEMRFVLNNIIDDEEILWLNAYVQAQIDANPNNAWGLLTPHSYIAYVYPNYQNPIFYVDENVAYFNELFAIPDKNSTVPNKKIGIFDTKFTIPGGTENPEYTITITRGTPNNIIGKVWMNFRNKFGTGAVCGGISKSGSNIRATHGIPATVIGQPGHAAILYYT
ncbi:MAG: NPCBM/NEW2 domain-containing protein, partial [Bacilli bacterium]|nr:NPCBM/NEW2 domain-containing protein [Bacilli bacterium]